jgi:sulfoxide reductase catalytic subunit YedY
MNYFIRRPFDLPQREHTPIEVFRDRGIHRRAFLESVGAGVLGIGLSSALGGCARPSEEEVRKVTLAEPLTTAAGDLYPAERNKKFEYGRPESARRDAAEYTNFYEFSPSKDSWRNVDKFQPHPWMVEIDGLCNKPQTVDFDKLLHQFPLEERAYRHRCVETWAMCVPWTGFVLRKLLETAEPQPQAKFVEFRSFERPLEAPQQSSSRFDWPYAEGLTIDEAMNGLTFVATGVYGESLPKQHGAPLRLVVPWKYGFKSIKSITKITFVTEQPKTFWNSLIPHEYPFESNVDPSKPHPRWSQETEWMLGTRERFPTKLHNGYGEWVAPLYS